MMSDGSFTVHCCRTGGRRIVLPGGVLACSDCDQTAKMPLADKATEAPEGVKFWQVPR